jgi:hypothetical protein
MSLQFAYSGMKPREVGSVRRDDLGDPRAGARSVLRASGAAVLPLQPATLGMLVMMAIRMAPRRPTSRHQVAIAAAAGAMLLFFSAHPLVLLAVR